ncbi:MAG: indole-3-glycerol phosphate synthase TrpC [Planctomycetaceae bacterium]|nr:indole-3-glycerol phosphate synthase TrpC [Planctomycetaceae bacterium]
MSNVLDRIVIHKRSEIEAARAAISESELRARLPDAPPPRDFEGSLRRHHPLGLIAEVKKASPSAGLIREDFDPVAIARCYADHGAACISVLTDEHFFQGKLEYLCAVRAAVSVPVLRKDFILDEYQLLEARVAGADCVLLIAECLADDELQRLYSAAAELGMQSLIEIYEPTNLDRVLALSPRPSFLGVNNRNLQNFVTDLDHCITIRQQLPAYMLLVGESGIHTREHVLRLQSAGIHAILVGESLMRSADIGAKVDDILGRST